MGYHQDVSDPINLKHALNGPVVVSNPNAQLPYKPGMHDDSPPPTYQEKPNFHKNNNSNTTKVTPTAPPARGTSARNMPNLDDLPSVPDNLPNESPRAHTSDDDDNTNNNNDGDISMDDLQKRFLNLKKN